MKVKYLILLLLSIISGFLSSQNSDKISDRIFELENHIVPSSRSVKGSYRKLYDSLRRELNIIEHVYKCNKRDTIYLMEVFGDGSDTELISTTWNRCDTLFCSYDFFNKKLFVGNKYGKYVFFSRYMYNLVSQWDCLKLEEESRGASLIPIDKIFAARIIITRRKYIVDYVIFKYFWDIDRDQIDVEWPSF